MKEGAMGRAIYDFITDIEGELPLSVGDIIQIHSIVDKYWYYGNSGGRYGKFPSSYVIEVSVPSFQEGQKVFVGLENFFSSVAGDLSFNKGDFIIGIVPVDNNWWKGQSGFGSGLFPVTHVWAVDDNLLKKAVGSVKEVCIRAKVKMNMTAQLDEEMDLHKDEIVTIVEIIDRDWYRGKCNGRTGIFPSSFVELIKDGEVQQSPLQQNRCESQFSSNSQDLTLSAKTQSSCSLLNQDSKISGIVPYCWSLFPFSGNHPDELSFNAGEIITLIRHIDDDWAEGESCGKVGMFPKSYVEIMVDCPSDIVQKSVHEEKIRPPSSKANIEIIPGCTQARALYDYMAQATGDLTLVEGEIITILSKLNSDWFEARDSQGLVGLCPAVYVECLPNMQSNELNNNIENSASFGSWELINNSTNSASLSSWDLLNNSTQSSPSFNKNAFDVNKSERESSSPSLPNKSFEFLESSSSLNSSVNRNSFTTSSSSLNSLAQDKDQKTKDLLYKLPSSLGPSALDKGIAKNIADFNLTCSKKPERTQSFGGIDFSNEWKTTQSNRECSQFLRKRSESLHTKIPPPRPAPPQIPKQVSCYSKDTPRHSTSIFSSVPPVDHISKLSHPNPPPVPPPPRISAFQEIVPQPPVVPPPPKVPLDECSESTLFQNTVQVPVLVPLRVAPPPPPPVVQSQSKKVQQTNFYLTGVNSRDVPDTKGHIPLRPAPPIPAARPTIRDSKAIEQTGHKPLSDIENDQNFYTQLQSAKQELDSCSSSQQCNANPSTNTFAPSSDDIMDETNYFEERKNEYIEANLEKRKLVISELLSTEYSYIHDLKACHEAFMTNPNEGKLKGIDMDTLFGNLHQIILVSEKLYRSLEDATTDKEPEDILIGPCFNAVSENMKSVYGNYCGSHEAVINLMEKYQDDLEIQNFFSEKLEIIRRQTSCFNLSSLLIKPVQRILKYPLLLKELVKYTEDDHPDKSKVENAIQMMMDLAASVNEFKRRKDLVEKYRKDADTSLASLLSKLTLHSVVKKSTRIGMRLSSSIGLTSVTKDEVFDEEEQKIRSLDKTLRTFLKDLTAFCMQLEDWVKIQFQTAEDIAKFYMDQCNCPEVDKYRTAHRELYSIILHDFKNFVTNRVVIPLTSVLQTFQGPLKLIDKRYDKLLDYDSSSLRLQKNKDVSKASQLNEEYQLTKNTYEALNSQLIEELPKLFNLALSVFQECVEDFAVARKRFIGRVVKQMLPLMELPSLHKINEDILESFQKAYVEACAELSLLSFVPKSLFPSKPDLSVKQSTEKKPVIINKDSETSQTESHRKLLQSNYPDNKLYVATYQHKAQDDYELTAAVGDILGVIKEQDPMGKTDRWFVDNGIAKGFIPSSCLRKHQISSISPLPSNVTPAGIPRTIASSKWYTQSTEGNGPEKNFPQQDSNEPKSRIPDLVISASSSENMPDFYDIPCDSSSHLYELPCDDVADNRYDIPAEEIGQLVDINEAKLPTVSSVSADNQESFPMTSTNFEYFHAAYEFSANSSSELSLRMGQVVRVLHKQDMQGNSEWWFVEDRYGNKGFVPANYLSKC